MIRSLQKTGGLFNCISNGGADVDKSGMSNMVNGLLNNEVQMYGNAMEHIISCGGSDLVDCCTDGDGTTDINELLTGSDCDLENMLDCEVFTDFSDLLLDADGLPFKLQTEETPQLPVAEISYQLPIKRAATESVSSAPGSSLQNADHNYHVPSKKKCTGETTALPEFPDECGDDIKHIRYLERRRKNNAASKRSRETKKTKMVGMEEQAVVLESENNSLRERIVELERLSALMKSLLVKKVSTVAQ